MSGSICQPPVMFQYLCNAPECTLENMAYTTNPNAPKVRMQAVRKVKQEGWTMTVVARHFGVDKGTISRWCAKDRSGGWRPIPTESSRPDTSPNALAPEIVGAIVTKRQGRRRCGQIIHQELMRDGVSVCLSSVQRTLDRCGLLKKKSVWKRPHDHTPRPEASHAGALVQVDTVHIMAPDGNRIYVYTLIDLYSRWAYAEVTKRIGAQASVQFVKRASMAAPFRFEMIQSDHGSEFSIWFTHGLWGMGMSHRHGRVRQSNDQAHVERFNRTIQEECLDYVPRRVAAFKNALSAYLEYYNRDRLHMGINYQTPLEMLQRS